MHRSIEIPIPTPSIQQVESLRIIPSKKLIESPVSQYTKIVSELSFLWNPEVENTNENVSSSNEKKNENEIEKENEIENKSESESEFSFFWISEETNENSSPLTRNSRPLNQSLKSAEVMEDSRPLKSMIKSSEVVVARPLKFPVVEESNEEALNENASQASIQNASTVPRSSPICETFLTILTTLLYIVPILISKTTSSPPHLNETRRFSTHKSKVPLQTKQQFSGTCVIKSRQLRPKKRWSPVHKTKATSLSLKPQFSGSCVIKSRQLQLKDCFLGTGWKKKRGKRVSHQYTMEASSYKPLRFVNDSFHSWK